MSSYPLGEELAGVVQKRRAAMTLQDQVAQLFEEARDDVFRYLLNLGLYPPQAQEATQEVFLRLYPALKKGEEIQNPRGWIFRVAHNLGLEDTSARELSSALRSGSGIASRRSDHGSGTEPAGAGADAAFSPGRPAAFRATAALSVAAAGRPAVSGNRIRPGNQRLSGRRIFAASYLAAKEG